MIVNPEQAAQMAGEAIGSGKAFIAIPVGTNVWRIIPPAGVCLELPDGETVLLRKG